MLLSKLLRVCKIAEWPRNARIILRDAEAELLLGSSDKAYSLCLVISYSFRKRFGGFTGWTNYRSSRGTASWRKARDVTEKASYIRELASGRKKGKSLVRGEYEQLDGITKSWVCLIACYYYTYLRDVDNLSRREPTYLPLFFSRALRDDLAEGKISYQSSYFPQDNLMQPDFHCRRIPVPKKYKQLAIAWRIARIKLRRALERRHAQFVWTQDQQLRWLRQARVFVIPSLKYALECVLDGKISSKDP